jgi:uncharacterized protein
MKQAICILIAVIISLFGQPLFAQTPVSTQNSKLETQNLPVHLKLKARNYGKKVVLRWAFNEPEAWRWLNAQGFTVERFELDHETNKAISSEFQTIATVKAWQKDAWAANGVTRDSFALIAAECLLGETKLPENTPMLRQMDLQSKDKANRFAFALLAADMSPLAADGLGLRFTDNDIKPNRKYVYRLSVPHDPTSRFVVDTTVSMVASDQITPQPEPFAPEVTAGDSLIGLTWIKSPEFTAYYIERSADGGKNWQKLTEKPFFNINPSKNAQNTEGGVPANTVFYSDRLTKNYVKFQYRLRGITSFGDVSAPSEAVETMGVDLTPTVAPRITFAENTKGNAIELKWDVAPAADLKGFVITKSVSMEGPWLDVENGKLPATARSFTDPEGDEFGVNHYRIYSLDDHDNRNGSMPVYVQMVNQAPPTAPVWVDANCKIDTNGKVTLTWLRGDEPDLWGYQVSYANKGEHEFNTITREILEDTTFSYTIPLNNLTEKIYFRVCAIDRNYALSKASPTLELAKPDKVPPTAPVIVDYEVSEKGIQLKFNNSTSADVEKQVLMRRVIGQKNWEKIAEFGTLKTQNSALKTENTEGGYFDSKVESRVRYEYAIYAIDDAGLSSKYSPIVAVQSFTMDKRGKIEDLKSTVVDDKNTIQLSWQYAQKSGVEYIVYRFFPDGSMNPIGKTSNTTTTFEDKNVAKGRSYTYAVKAFHADGNQSVLAKTTPVGM